MKIFMVVLGAVVAWLASNTQSFAPGAAAPAPAPSLIFDERLVEARALLDNAGRELQAHAAGIDTRSGLATQLRLRLRTHTARLNAGGDTEESLRLAELDSALVDQLANQAYLTLSTVRGISSAVLPAIGPQQRAYPLALFVPASYSPDTASSLVIYIHGKGQSEADVIASPLLRALATDTRSVLVAPYMRGDDMLADDSIAELYQMLDAVEHSLNVDRRHVYLAGNSLGGFAAFKALSQHPERWSAMLVVQGAVAERDSSSVASHVRNKPIYLVGGGNDQSVKATYVRQLAEWLRRNGALVTYYEQPEGIHTLESVAPALGQAWRDMFAGIRPAVEGEDVLPPTPAPTRRP